MKYLLIALLLISIDSVAQKDTATATLTGAKSDTTWKILTIGTAITESGWTYSHSLSKPDTSAVIMLYCDTTRAKGFPDVYESNFTVLEAGLCFWTRGYAVTQINKLTYYLDDKKRPFDKVVWMSFTTKKQE